MHQACTADCSQFCMKIESNRYTSVCIFEEVGLFLIATALMRRTI